jgi:general secretion pathway protein E
MQGPYLQISEEGRVREIPLGEDPLTIGRHSDNRLIITDTLSSRFHCHISKSPNGTFLIRDLNSSNGTVVNGHVTRFTQLWPGDTISIGKTRMVFLDPSGKTPTRPPDKSDIVDLGRPNPALASGTAAPTTAAPTPAALSRPRPAASNGAPPPAQAEEPEALTDADIVEDELPGVTDDAPASFLPEPIPDDIEPMIPVADDLVESEPLFDAIPLDDLDSAPPEELAEDDLVPVDDLDAVENDAAGSDVVDNDMVEEGLAEAQDPSDIVESLVNSLPNQPFEESEIALMNARGKATHPAGAPTPRGKREAVDWLRLLLLLCSRSRATDVHFEPKEDDFLLRMRVDGTMVEICRLPALLGGRLLALVKVLCELDPTQKTIVQEGHFSARVPRGDRGPLDRIDYRVSLAPSVFGQKLVIRVLDTSYAPLTVRSLQLPRWMCQSIEQAIGNNAGMVLVCGPTGSGKTTTLYALTRSCGIETRNVLTIEDPVEIQIEGVTQIPVDETHDKTFSSLLRSALRQDPDVILIGEIRDAETARIAMQAAITGHLVFSTVHAQSTIGTVFRLLDLGAEPYLVSQAIHLVLAQRLVRNLCQYCRVATRPTPAQLKSMGDAAAGVTRIYEPGHCVRCLNTGYSGRQAVFELLLATPQVRELILKTPTTAQLEAALSSTPFQRLSRSGFELVANGITSFTEVSRVIGE